jgi:hypothetical protein
MNASLPKLKNDRRSQSLGVVMSKAEKIELEEQRLREPDSYEGRCSPSWSITVMLREYKGRTSVHDGQMTCPPVPASVPLRMPSCFKDLCVLCFRLNKK